jgi:hypothetical protein
MHVELCLMMVKVNNRYQKNVEGVLLPYKLIETAKENGYLKALSLFVALKSKHKNGVFYDSTSRSISAGTGFSHASINTHIKTLIALGLAIRQMGKNGKIQLRLRGYKFYTTIWGKELVFIKYGSKKEVNESLRAQIAIKHIKNQEYNIGRKQGRNRKMGKIVESPTNYASLSDRKLAQIMGVSNCTANQMKASWSNLGLITVRPMWSVIQTGVSESHYRQAKSFGAIPVHAVYEKNRKRILLRLADAVSIGTDYNYKYRPNSWVPPMVSGGRKQAINQVELKPILTH